MLKTFKPLKSQNFFNFTDIMLDIEYVKTQRCIARDYNLCVPL